MKKKKDFIEKIQGWTKTKHMLLYNQVWLTDSTKFERNKNDIKTESESNT